MNVLIEPTDGEAGALGWIDRAIGTLASVAQLLACVCILAIIVLGVADTFGGVLFNAPVMGTLEITEALLAMAIFLALGRALEMGQHIVVDVVTEKLNRPWRLALHIFALIVIFFVFALLSWQSVLSAARAWRAAEVTASYLPVPVPVWFAKSLSAIGLCIATLEATRQIAWVIGRRDVAAGRRRQRAAGDEDQASEQGM